MARVITTKNRASIDPLKHSQPLGGVLVFLGLAETMPMLHGSQGCSAFAKALLTRVFREPIPLQTTAVTEVTAVLGAGDLLGTALDTIREKQHPEIIGVLTTGLTEVNGEDVAGELRAYHDRRADDGPLVVRVSTPDFRGGLSDGWSAALAALLRDTPLDELDVSTRLSDRRVAVLAGPALTSADLDEIVDLVESYGLEPTIVPDLAGSLDGHLAAEWSPLTTGGTTLAQLRRLGECGRIIAVGPTTAAAAEVLAGRTGAQVSQFDHLAGLAATDALVGELAALANRAGSDAAGAAVGTTPPRRVARDRARLADALLDTHFFLGGARVALAGEPEQLLATASLLRDVGAEVVAAVSPTADPALERVPCDEVAVGDLSELERRARSAGAEVVLASSHARATAARIGAAFLPFGFPVYDRLGATLRPTCGYRGSRELLTDLTNTLLDHREPVSQAARHGVLGRSRTTCTPRDLRPSVASTWDTGKSEPRSQSDTRASDVITESHEESMC
ncbi:MAG TPA: nitrogenase iron-molybdenum cofactor biosynthesis protein NifN [Pseudonocardiaceae bacterium]